MSNNCEQQPTSEDTRPIEERVLSFLCTLHDNHDIDDQQWVRSLLDHGINNNTSEVIELGTLIQTTVMDTLLAKLLGISPAVLAKAAIVEEYICTIWEHNNLDKQSLYNFILDNPQQREAILQLIQPRKEQIPPPIQTVDQQGHPPETMHGSHVIQPIPEETNIQEIVMTEATIETVAIQDNATEVIAHDIKDIPEYKIRNRVAQPTNPFFVTQTGSYTAGVLMANTPGSNKEEQTNYLKHTLNLPKENKNLIGAAFLKGNYWYTFNFELQLDMINCVQKLNNKNDGDFKILYLKGAPAEEPKSSTISKNKSLKEEKRIREVVNSDKTTKAATNTHSSTAAQQTSPHNPYKLLKGKSKVGIGMLVGTFPGQNRQEQLAILAEIFRTPVNSEYINIEHINGNSWFTGFFNTEEDRTLCINKTEEVNKEIINIDSTSEKRTFKIIKLEDILPKNYNSSKHTNKKQVNEHASQNSQETSVQILDIPEDFSTSRIKGAVRNYGSITKIQIQSNRHNRPKTAIITFSSIKIDLDRTWAIPMGNIMARIAPSQAEEEIFTIRNQHTARLYGIGKDCSATRIMSAIKHTGAKTVHIPTNSKTGKKRRFAIVGYEDNNDLDKAISSNVTLFGCKTWWSTKDNAKALATNTLRQKERMYQQIHQQVGQQDDSDSNTESIHDQEERKKPYNNRRNNQRREKYKEDQDNYSVYSDSDNTLNSRFSTKKYDNNNTKKTRDILERVSVKQPRKNYSSKGRRYSQEPEDSFDQLSSVLQEISERLSKLEIRDRKGKGVSRS